MKFPGPWGFKRKTLVFFIPDFSNLLWIQNCNLFSKFMNQCPGFHVGVSGGHTSGSGSGGTTRVNTISKRCPEWTFLSADLIWTHHSLLKILYWRPRCLKDNDCVSCASQIPLSGLWFLLPGVSVSSSHVFLTELLSAGLALASRCCFSVACCCQEISPSQFCSPL